MSHRGKSRPALLERARRARVQVDEQGRQTHLDWQLREQRDCAIPCIQRVLGVELTPSDFTPVNDHGWERVPQRFTIDGLHFEYERDYRNGHDHSRIWLLTRTGSRWRLIERLADLDGANYADRRSRWWRR